MKIFVILFSIYFLFLNITPCNDGDATCTDHSEQVTQDNHDHEHDNHESHDHEEDCSPFCQCNCCSVNVWNDNLLIIIPGLKNSENYISISYQNQFLDSYNGTILQPPQLID